MLIGICVKIIQILWFFFFFKLHVDHARNIRRASGLNPRVSAVELVGGEVEGLARSQSLDALPLDSLAGVGAGASVAELGVEAGVDPEGAGPRHPPLWLDQFVDLGLHHDGPGVGLPWPPEVRLVDRLDRQVRRVAGDGAVLEDYGRRAPLVRPALGGDDAVLVVQRLPHDHLAVLEHRRGIAEDEVDGAGDGAVPVELSVGVGVEGVLVPVHVAVVEDGEVGVHSQCHGLVLGRSRGVLEPHVLGHEVGSHYGCVCIRTHVSFTTKSTQCKQTHTHREHIPYTYHAINNNSVS